MYSVPNTQDTGPLAVRDTKINETLILETMHILVEETGCYGQGLTTK